MTREKIKNRYFEWLCNMVCENRYSKHISFELLLAHLHNTMFRFSIPKDQNRAEDGMELRYRFSLYYDENYDPDYIVDVLDGPCSVLEMMVALAVRCEEDMMDDPDIGSRTGQWFWGMISNLGLGAVTDDRYDRQYVDEALDIFLDREYEPDGRGGLFTVRRCEYDLRKVEIWTQLNWYINSISDI